MKIVVLTSNKYVHCIPGFMYLFNKHCAAPLDVDIVGYNVAPSSLLPNYNWVSLGDQKDYTWSSGLAYYLDHSIPHIEHVLFLLDDYFMSAPVGLDMIDHMYETMLSQSNIVKVDLSGDRLKFPHRMLEQFVVSIVSTPDSAFQTSTQAAIWRTDFLRRFLQPSENAWQFEKKGTKRVIQARELQAFDGVILGTISPAMTYVNAIGGEGNMPKVWAKKRFPQALWNELIELGYVKDN